MKLNKYILSIVSTLLVLTTPIASADGLVGTWKGEFQGGQIGLQSGGPFGQWGQPGQESTKPNSPVFVKAPLTVTFGYDNNSLAVGSWSAGEFAQQFVCAEHQPGQWICQDRGGRSIVNVKSSSEIRVCYFDNREGALGAGCATLKKQ